MIRYLSRNTFGNPINILYSYRLASHQDDMHALLLALDYFDIEEFDKEIKYTHKHY